MTEGILSATNTISLTTAPYVILKKFDDYGATYELRAYTKMPNEYQKLQSEIRKNVYDIFHKHGLDLTVPQAQTDIVKNDLNGKIEKSHQN